MRRSLVRITHEQKLDVPPGKEVDVLLGCPVGTSLIEQYENPNDQTLIYVVENVCFEDFLHPSDYPTVEINVKECLKDKKQEYVLGNGSFSSGETNIFIGHGTTIRNPNGLWYVNGDASSIPRWETMEIDILI